jgi:hypothetical protein
MIALEQVEVALRDALRRILSSGKLAMAIAGWFKLL